MHWVFKTNTLKIGTMMDSHQEWRPTFDPQYQDDGRRELTPSSYLWASPAHHDTHTFYTDRRIKCNRFFKEGYSRTEPLLPPWLQVCLYSCHRNVFCFTFIIFYYFYILFIIFLIKWYFLYQVFLFLDINHFPNYDTEIYYWFWMLGLV